MELLEEKIRQEGLVKGQGILKVDSFLNHQLDVKLFEEMGKVFAKRFAGEGVNKILTIETSGIAIATSTSRYFDYCPVVFGKKYVSLNLDEEIYSSDVYSYTKQQAYKIMVSKKYLNPTNGKAVEALIDLINQAGATLVGVGIAIEKGFQDGGALIREQGVALESLAIIDDMSKEKGIIFRDQSGKK